MYYIGIDLGGTNIKAGVVDEKGNILKKASKPTLPQRNSDEILEDIYNLCMEVSEGIEKIESIGMGVPGACSNKDGIVLFTSNINMKDVKVREFFAKKTDIPIYVENDANCAALGEFACLEKKVSDVVFVTLGTGIGSGLILNGKLYTGFNGIAGEAGHIMLKPDGKKCGCGRRGCWEAYGSVTALISQTKEYAIAHPDSELRKIIGENFEKLSGKTAFELARKGDKDGKIIVDTWISYVASGITDLINLLQPELVLIGGAISKEGDFLLKPLIKTVQEEKYKCNTKDTEVRIARLGNDAGLIGAAYLGK